MAIPRWADGSGVANVANSNADGGIALVHVFDIADASSADYSITPHQALEVLDVQVIKP